MNRVSGWHRRQTQVILLAIGRLVNVSANASNVHVVRNLWQDDAPRYAVAQWAVVAASDAETADSLRMPDHIQASLPLGWAGQDPWGRE